MIRAAILEKPLTPIGVQSLPEPVLEPGAALLETIFSEVCGTDVHLYLIQLSPATSTSVGLKK